MNKGQIEQIVEDIMVFVQNNPVKYINFWSDELFSDELVKDFYQTNPQLNKSDIKNLCKTINAVLYKHVTDLFDKYYINVDNLIYDVVNKECVVVEEDGFVRHTFDLSHSCEIIPDFIKSLLEEE